MFQGRYGMDRLNRTLIFIAVGISVVSLFLPRASTAGMIITGVSTALIIVVLLRMFSRNFAARQSELYRYLALENKLRAFWARARGGYRKQADELKDRRKYKYLTCPQCSQRLRVPKGKGKLRVTCTRCGNRFETKS
ncbi:MAG: hypothetical protein AAGU74_14675 [Bacillota bacterium]